MVFLVRYAAYDEIDLPEHEKYVLSAWRLCLKMSVASRWTASLVSLTEETTFPLTLLPWFRMQSMSERHAQFYPSPGMYVYGGAYSQHKYTYKNILKLEF